MIGRLKLKNLLLVVSYFKCDVMSLQYLFKQVFALKVFEFSTSNIEVLVGARCFKHTQRIYVMWGPGIVDIHDPRGNLGAALTYTCMHNNNNTISTIGREDEFTIAVKSLNLLL